MNSIVYASGGTAIAVVVGGLAAFGARADARGDPDCRRRRSLLAPARRVGGDARLRLPDRLRRRRRSTSAPSPWIVPVVQALVAIPFVVRIVAPTLRAIDQRQREAAALARRVARRASGARSTCRSSRARSPSRPGFAFAISLGEFGATVFLARPDRPTLPVAIFRFLGRPGAANFGQAYTARVTS